LRSHAVVAMAVAVTHHVPTVMIVAHHVTAHVTVAPHSMTAALTLRVVHADVDDAGRGIDGPDQAGGGRCRCDDAEGAERGQGGDGEY